MNGCAPRALEEIVRPRRLAGLGARPLNFTVRTPMRSHWPTIYFAAMAVVAFGFSCWVRVYFFDSPMCQLSNAGGNWF